MKVDIIVPTCKAPRDVAPLLNEIRRTRTGEGIVYATCEKASAAVNRNLGLERCRSPFICMVDDDITNFVTGWDEALAKPLQESPKACMTSARLLSPNGSFGQMLGHAAPRDSGLTLVELQELPTACICIRNDGTRFDETYQGSGWEDTDFSARLRGIYPDGEWYVVEDVRVIHLNEQKHQHEGGIFTRNKSHYRAMWGEPR